MISCVEWKENNTLISTRFLYDYNYKNKINIYLFIYLFYLKQEGDFICL